ncbi:ATP-binding protein [Streptomyces sp. NPDC057638]|uniref:ATP-binding protein n=1 Tax=Streptomyces sp. NPDC057638 TaxID=3346190 RepID=UPI00368DEA08
MSLLLPPASPPPSRRYRFAAPNQPPSAAILRDTVGAILRVLDLGVLLDDARLCTSETVTNVHRHTGADTVVVDVLLGPGRVTVRVHDDDPRALPELRPPGPGGVGGRGLHLVDDLSDRWGATRCGGVVPTGKIVWFAFDLASRGVVVA